ncbi:MAG: VOC family protein [Chloroflexi bacterium]|nr:VOC family protein [Chloroflexota bacterium]OJV89397.1 MAG: hypothetical protein BGO39_36060 [Chloroflexi bacterium 54-19]
MKTKQESPAFSGVATILNVNNVPESLEYYRDKLGFKLAFAWSEPENNPPTFAEVKRDMFRLMLCQQCQGSPGTWIYLDMPSVEDLGALHGELEASGAIIAEVPTDKPWGMREMLVKDLDGHTLRIGAPLFE